LTNPNNMVIVISHMELTVAQFAAKLGVSSSRVRQMVIAKQIKARHLTPRMLMIDSTELAKVRNRKPGRPKKSK
jgi:hypothetical protein